MKKVIIIGAGISGLSAGIHLAKAGYEVSIYEKNPVAGGNCSAWKRGDYTIDNCIHWMTGTHKGTIQYAYWDEIGGLSDDVKIIQRDAFYTSELNGQSITLWRDIDRTKKEMLELSPEDEEEINLFIESTRLVMKFQEPKVNYKDIKNALGDFNDFIPKTEIGRILMRYLNLSQEEWAKRFKHPLLQKLICDNLAKEYESYWMIMAYSIWLSGNGDLPEGGSKGLIERLVKSFTDAGGKLYLNKPAKQIVLGEHFEMTQDIFGGRSLFFYKMKKMFCRNAEYVLLEDGTKVIGDYVVCACDVNYTFSNLLKRKYMPRSMRSVKKQKKYPVYSSFQTAFSVDGEMPELNDTLYFDCEPFTVAKQNVERFSVKNYRIYGDYIAPKGQTVIQCSINQYRQDYDFWKKLSSDKEAYKAKKNEYAAEVLKRVEKRFPQYAGKIHLLDTWTPYTYSKWSHNYKGAYMRFITTATSSNAFISCVVPKLGNVLLANHWLKYPGGVLMSAMDGKLAANKIFQMEKEVGIHSGKKSKKSEENDEN